MRVQEKNRKEIEAKLAGFHDFLKMEYLESCAKSDVTLDAKIFCYSKLAELYASRNMFSEAAKNMSILAGISPTFREKIEAHKKEASFLIKSGQYDKTDEALKKAISYANQKEKPEIKVYVKEEYKKQAAEYEKANKSGSALKVYEKLVQIVDESEKQEIKKRLLDLYGKLGKHSEYFMMKGKM